MGSTIHYNGVGRRIQNYRMGGWKIRGADRPDATLAIDRAAPAPLTGKLAAAAPATGSD